MGEEWGMGGGDGRNETWGGGGMGMRIDRM